MAIFFGKKRKIRPGGGEKVSRPGAAWREGKFSKEKNAERLISLFGSFHKKINDIERRKNE